MSLPQLAGLASLAVLAAAVPAQADCKFDKMLKVISQEVTPGLAADSFANKPKTTYRLGSQYGRSEEAEDSGRGLEQLIVVNEPDLWFINRTSRSGRHLVDPGPTFDFHAVIAWTPELPLALRSLEFGCEVAFMKANGAKAPASVLVKGEAVARYSVNVGDLRVTLDVAKLDETPRNLTIERKGKTVVALRYLTWKQGLEPDLELFKPPAGLDLVEPPASH